MYVAVKGGEAAIDAAHAQLAARRRGDPGVAALTVAQIRDQMALAVARIMAEGSLYDPDLAALALKQAWGDVAEAIFLVRAYRTTLPRLAVTRPLDTAAMAVQRRISATFKDLPGGQVLGPTFDYTHRLIDFALAAEDGEDTREPPPRAETPLDAAMPRVADILDADGLIEPETDPDADNPDAPVPDLTRAPLTFPAGRALRLQALARGDEGFLLSLAYSSQRGHGTTHPFAGEIRMGTVEVEIIPEDLGFPVTIGAVTVTECQMINQFQGSRTAPPQFTRGYGLVFGFAERKAMAMALVDRALRAPDLGEAVGAPAQDEEFVLSHLDVVEASGFVQHLKLPHYVDFQAELDAVRRMRRAASAEGESP
jgi:alpha-D-ribose 1-methylphosphonate 5-triphosphate synthase subunit PhnI